jgi:hypothetical protein
MPSRRSLAFLSGCLVAGSLMLVPPARADDSDNGGDDRSNIGQSVLQILDNALGTPAPRPSPPAGGGGDNSTGHRGDASSGDGRSGDKDGSTH